MNKRRMIAIVSLILFSGIFTSNLNHIFRMRSYKKSMKTSSNNLSNTTNKNKVKKVVKFEIDGKGEFSVELYPEFAPKTVENFISLVNTGFYNNLTFHRVVDGFMVQGGDPNGDGTGGANTILEGEFSDNNFPQNTLKHKRGTISMARGQDPNSAKSQFFICLVDCEYLDGKYAAFGEVVSGMEVIDEFTKTERKVNEMGEMAIPIEPIIIKKASFIN